MVFKPWQKKQSFEFQVFINEQPILRVSETMFLGVLLEENVFSKTRFGKKGGKNSSQPTAKFMR